MEACPIADIFRPSATASQVPGSSIDRYNNFITGTLAPSPPVVCVSVGPCSCQSPQSCPARDRNGISGFVCLQGRIEDKRAASCLAVNS